MNHKNTGNIINYRYPSIEMTFCRGAIMGANVLLSTRHIHLCQACLPCCLIENSWTLFSEWIC